jgi:class 3 adenylate cyclase
MAKFSVERFPAGFFDVTRDIAGPLPIELIERWTRGAQTPEAARQMLQPYAVEGIAVSSDGSGLTRLTGSRPLLDILSLLDHPKQLVHAYGTAIGGEAVGLWTADNTQMFYPQQAPARDVAAMLLTLQDEVRGQCDVQIGVAAHAGRVFKLAGGLYGSAADRVESLAETYAGPGDIVITEEFRSHISEPELFDTAPHLAVPASLGSNLRLMGGPRRTGLDARNSSYPIPYSEDFYADLLRVATGSGEAAEIEQVHKSYGRQRAVTLIEREREETETDEIAVLNEMAMSLAMRKVGRSLLDGTGGHEVNTGIGIYTFEDCRAALDYTRRFRDALLKQGIQCRGAIDFGDILVFRVHEGLEDIAGLPVNLASKIAQDNGEFGKIYLSAAAARQVQMEAGFRPVRFAIAGIDVDAFME